MIAIWPLLVFLHCQYEQALNKKANELESARLSIQEMKSAFASMMEVRLQALMNKKWHHRLADGVSERAGRLR